MSEDQSDSVKDISATSFGYAIAFLLPGIFGLYALSFWFPQVTVLLQPILKADASVGPSFLFLVVAIGVGVCISGLRHFIFEKGLYRKNQLSSDIYQGMTPEQLAVHRGIAEEHYRYHQFYGGCAIALLVLFVGWYWNSHPTWPMIAYRSIGFALFLLLLERSSADSYYKCVEKSRKIVEPTKDQKASAAAK